MIVNKLLTYTIFIILLTSFFSLTSHASTFLYLNSEAGDYIGQGQTKTITDNDQTFSASRNYDNGVSISTSGSLWWTINFAAAGNLELSPGYYDNAIRFPFQAITQNGLSASGEGRGCNTLTGRYYIHEVSFIADEVNVFAADFEQYCGNSTSKLTGSVRINSTIPISPLPISIAIPPSDYAYATDGGVNADWTMDGSFDLMTSGGDVFITKYRSLDFTQWLERRGAYEFLLPSILSNPNVTITSATLNLPTITSGVSGYGDYLIPYGYSANGVIELSDFETTPFPLETALISSSDHEINVTSFIQSIASNSSHAGFNIAVSWWDAYVTMAANAELKIVYTINAPVINTAPVITINAPMAENTYYVNTDIALSATAFDQEDGNITTNLTWFGPYFPAPLSAESTKIIFEPGSYTFTAMVTDSAGDTVNKDVIINVVANTPPNLNVMSPLPFSTFIEGDMINLEALATDIQDGDISNSISWSSNIDGQLGSGGQLMLSTLTPSVHTITVIATDSGGMSSSSNFVLTVSPMINSIPVLNISSPSNQSIISTGSTVTLEATATDLEDGNLSNLIAWTSNLDGFLGQGGLITDVLLSSGDHQINASVVDSSNNNTTTHINITVTSVMPTYCAAKGNNVYYEWADSVEFNDVTKISGANTGYADFTLEPAITLNNGSNSIALTPGFQSSYYNEYWGIWIDLNEDFQFSADEQVYSGNSTSVISSTMTLPSGIVGLKRMRVVMKYGSAAQACGEFTYGEVEDYMVNIVEDLPSTPTPTPTPVKYCPSSSNNTNWEWINNVSVGSISNTSSNSMGYEDFTAITAFEMGVGTNPLSLSPGFSGGSYTEQWQVWIDFDHDNLFSSEERVFAGSSSESINATITLPTHALTGLTRMRVTMSYGTPAAACSSFTYGEVEDYTVNIN